MKVQPFQHLSALPRWETADEEHPAGHLDDGFVTPIAGVEVRNSVIADVHVDHDAVKRTQPWHGVGIINVPARPAGGLS